MVRKPAQIHCDGCDERLYSEDESRERWFRLSTPHNERDMDICRECWRKMCAVVGINPSITAERP